MCGEMRIKEIKENTLERIWKEKEEGDFEFELTINF